MTKTEDVTYKYAVKVVEWAGEQPFVREYSPDWGFGWFNGTVQNAQLFDSASEAERAITRRNEVNYKDLAFVVVPVKVTTTRIVRESTEESRVLA